MKCKRGEQGSTLHIFSEAPQYIYFSIGLKLWLKQIVAG